VEAVIGHIKNDCRIARNYLKAAAGDNINLLLSCAAFNFQQLMGELAFYLLKLLAALRYFIANQDKASVKFS